MKTNFFKNSVVYQVYPMSFNDSNNDGMGDILGIVEKLDYLKELGINVIWLSPVYESPMDDNGYDISDYYKVGKQFGTLEDIQLLLAEAHKREIKIIMDLVVNHTSDMHVWFQEALKGKDNPYRDYYIWRDEPNKLTSYFSGSAWELDEASNQYFFHLFSKRQPDLNWENEAMRKEIYKMINYWLDMGFDGFRLDVIELIGKQPDLFITGNGPKLHELIKEMHKECFEGRDIMTVGETGGVTPETAKYYTHPDEKELDLVFQFQHIALDEVRGHDKWTLRDLDLIELKEVLSKWQTTLYNEAWNSLYWSNHDQPRIVSRWGNDSKYRVESAKMLGILLHFMQGTPFIYQGEEIGMTNIKLKDISDYKDVETLNMYKDKLSKGFTHDNIMNSIYVKGRDNARTPMQWDDSKNAGFSNAEPWLCVNPNYKDINAKKVVEDKDSIFYTYKELIALRRNSSYSDIIIDGKYELLLKEDKNLFAYTRTLGKEVILVVCNFSDKETNVSIDENVDHLIIKNYKDSNDSLNGLYKPYEAKVFKLK